MPFCHHVMFVMNINLAFAFDDIYSYNIWYLKSPKQVNEKNQMKHVI